MWPRAREIGTALAVIALAIGGVACVEPATEHRVRANAFLRAGDAEGALKECDLGLTKKEGDPGLQILRGKALFELDRFDDARASYQAAVAQKDEAGSLAEAHLGLAMIAARKREWPEARARFEELVKINPKDATSHLNVARACLELKDMACAIEHGETAGKLRGDEEGVLYTLGTIYLAAGKPTEAELTFKHICEVVPNASSCPYGVALVAAKGGDKAKALASLRDAVGRKIPNPEHIATDPGFASIRDEQEFKDLVAQATAK